MTTRLLQLQRRLTGCIRSTLGMALVPALLALGLTEAAARNQIRQAFFQNYPSALGSPLDTVPSAPGHCGVCHYKFGGGGARNPYGVAVGNNLSAGNSNAVWIIRDQDSDNDGHTTLVEVTSTAYDNTPTFPGLTPANVNLVSGVAVADLKDYLVPASGVDTTPPQVEVAFPDGGEVLTGNRGTNVTWTASDASGIAGVSLYLSLDNGATWEPEALGIANTGSHAWTPANRPSTRAILRVVALDNAGNSAADESDAVFRIVSPEGGRVPSTLRDFDMPGTQPLEHGLELANSASCATCHGHYNASHEPYVNWQGSMMSHGSRDVIFRANMVIANQDAPDSGDLCLRCHLARGWLGGRSVPTDGSGMLPPDGDGVTCDLCHRMVDPVWKPGISPNADSNILAALTFRGTNQGNGMFVIDPSATQRGPFGDADAPHTFLASPFHRSAALCGTCHDVSNPAFTRDAQGNYATNAFDTTGTNFSPHFMAPVERTYSEWLASDYNTPDGVYAPEFAGNKPDGRVATCQDCHMRDVSGHGCNTNLAAGAPYRTDLPLHDLTGGSTWLPLLLTNLHPAEVNPGAIQAGVARATELLGHAADLALSLSGGQLKVTVTNNTGHKLPTGYPEGRRIWLNVKFYDAATNLLGESGAYDPETGVLSHDAQAKIYEVHPALATNLATLLGMAPGPSFHFVLNNVIYDDNRIPPRGFTNAAFEAFGGAPAGYGYADGQYWDDTFYALPAGTMRAEARLYYQSTSKEFIEFLRDENTTDDQGEELYALWSANGKCPPTLMQEAVWVPVFLLQSMQFQDGVLHIRFRSRPGVTYTIEYTDSLDGTPVWHPFQNQGTLTATTTESGFADDFTTSTSGGRPPTGMRFYRFSHNGTP
ncbi:MAG: hypothetical protein JXQ71_11965 [Verrucomicrobia bacterium]|nr:hypothetical protein [Verrucomicrobiota bacterium]